MDIWAQVIHDQHKVLTTYSWPCYTAQVLQRTGAFSLQNFEDEEQYWIFSMQHSYSDQAEGVRPKLNETFSRNGQQAVLWHSPFGLKSRQSRGDNRDPPAEN